jgi:hypothetical protein
VSLTLCLRQLPARVFLSLLFVAFPFSAQIARAVTAPPPAKLEFLSDTEILDRAATLSVEDLRYLVYLYAHLNKPHLAEAISTYILSANPSDRQTLLVLASMAVEQKDSAATLRLARRFLSYYPGDQQGRYFLGAGHYLAKHYDQANAVLRDLKREQFIARKYPYETDLAASAYAAGDWFRAMLAYQELLRHHALSDELRDEVRRVLDGLYREHLPRVEYSANETRLNRARVWRTVVSEGSHLSDRHWLDLRYTRDDVSLDAAPTLRPTHAPRAEVEANLATVYDRRWWSDAWLGASGEGLLAGARAHYRFAKDREAAIDVSLNERATDSLTLEALDGRQHRAGIGVNWLVEADLNFVARASFRELRVASQSIGRSAGLDFNLDQTLTREGHGPRFIVGYRASLAAFTPTDSASPALAEPIADPALGLGAQQALLANLVSRRINRHGFGLQITDNMAHAWHYRFTAGTDYDFELSSVGWNASLALSFFPRKSIELGTEGGYASSATSSNAGSSAVLLNFFIRSYY